eukprot:TRINITY_DN8274_c0_g2_i1.p1 TRINITY_DN8274_c0_g2~~TRINITY_DN8274_c0_g2_i1.p1  ORF type:complete len:372 (-),score=23.84 TRINITY_DN8274_c0_g2_i1:454-1569(-)
MSSLWKSLKCPANELRLDVTLPTGQSFRWKAVGKGVYVGVVGKRVVAMKEKPNDIEYQVIGRDAGVSEDEDLSVLQDYFNLSYKLNDMVQEWMTKDHRFQQIAPLFPGARMLRQDPVECLFSFLCSQNNHILRIQGMVEKLAGQYGTQLPTKSMLSILEGSSEEEMSNFSFYAFPTLAQLQDATEADLRANGFGYRAKYVVDTVNVLCALNGGGVSWLQSLRKEATYQEAHKQLCTLPGIGPKVAACICLFSLDKHQAIPVDTHVWQLACRYYTPHLKDRKSVTPRIMQEVELAFIEKFGPMAGWAHNILFVSELAQLKDRLPEELQPVTSNKRKQQQGDNKSEKRPESVQSNCKKSTKRTSQRPQQARKR